MAQMKRRSQLSNCLRAAIAGSLCLACGLLIGYQASNIKQQSTKVNLKLSSHGSVQTSEPQISARHVRQQYRYLQPAKIQSISMHTIIPTGCDRWQDFQMAGLYWSFLR